MATNKACAIALCCGLAAAAPTTKPSMKELDVHAHDHLVKPLFEIDFNFGITSAVLYTDAQCTNFLQDITPLATGVTPGGERPMGSSGYGACTKNMIGSADAKFTCDSFGTFKVIEYDLDSGCSTGATAPLTINNGGCGYNPAGFYVTLKYTGFCS